MNHETIAAYIADGKAVLGIEFGSTRIKAVLIGPDHAPVAMGAHDWENRLEDGVWTYHLDDVWTGIQDAYADLARNTLETFGEPLARLEAVGVSAMMHGYLPFDAAGNQLAPFRTWRNTMTAKAAEELTALFSFNIPQRWSIAHLYQAILNGEEHVKDIAFLTTLAGYVHWKLTGVKALGVGDASGMFPIDSETGDYDAGMLAAFDAKIAAKGYPWKLRDILPEVLGAGEDAGCLTEAGARLLDPTGALEAGAPLCPPEGDAGTGMAATNSVAERTGKPAVAIELADGQLVTGRTTELFGAASAAVLNALKTIAGIDDAIKLIAPDVIASIAAMAPRRVVYVSCDPGTLGRDVKRFAELGYLARRAVAVDLFPRTRHVETVCLMSRSSG